MSKATTGKPAWSSEGTDKAQYTENLSILAAVMLPTPDTSHAEKLPVYPPSEDSFLMLDVLETQQGFLTSHFYHGPAPVVLEIGSGSGVVVAFLTAHCLEIFGQKNVLSMAIDINPFACKASQQTVETAVRSNSASSGYFLNSCMGDLTTALRPGIVDVLLFNPPYVPSDDLPQAVMVPSLPITIDFDIVSAFLDLAVSGGVDGMEVTSRLLDQLEQALSDRGIGYILLCARNKPATVTTTLMQRGWTVDKVGGSGKKGGIENLSILRVSRAA